ncbi:MAG: hypothetical protein B7Y59_11490 [Burkholderiales bacterium 35-55-47]|nr:MAG: hypothetical protein B7Y59_11490 [Burkholderiales bacterium 35-55-47]OYZ72030.1 MAG: hypothetical protein B7Y06_12495 [Burkholderiales bacterium 24-55-52]OZA99040.1 MAG: hypothetical protein B7X62_12205 [Burkholderiales bacterium 39-55-53]HQS27008.1 hypothetical protein [Limnohabitans sp.]
MQTDKPNKKAPHMRGFFSSDQICRCISLIAQSVSEWAGYEAIFWRVATDEPTGLPVRSRAQAKGKLSA